MVAGDREYRDAEGRQKGAQVGVFLWLAAFHEITGKDNDLRQRIKPVERRYGPLQSRGGVHHPFEQHARRQYVGVGYLSDEHHRLAVVLSNRLVLPRRTKMPCSASRLARLQRGSRAEGRTRRSRVTLREN